MSLELAVLAERFAVCRLDAGTPPPPWALSGSFVSVTLSSEETSIVCEESLVPTGVKAEGGWRAFRVAGHLDLSLTGVLVSMAAPLADAGVGIFAVSTFDTDYILVLEGSLDRAVSALRGAGHSVELLA